MEALSREDHYPVMLEEVLAALSPRGGEAYVDGTFGAGGYSRAILDAADCNLYAIDRDENALATAQGVTQDYGSRFKFLRGCFGDVEKLLNAHRVDRVDGLVLDVGVSSMQIDQADRGFSFRFDGPLDMRMDTSQGETAADIVNMYDEDDLADIIYRYGEERFSRRIARKIADRRTQERFTHTLDLANVVRDALPKGRNDRIDPATRTFQALRIAVNDELGELERALHASENILNDGGRLVVVSFHSLEDGMVKRFLKAKSGGQSVSRHIPQVTPSVSIFKMKSKKAVKPSDKEVQENARSRSARLRSAVRCERVVVA